jgi:hypothetical protein
MQYLPTTLKAIRAYSALLLGMIMRLFFRWWFQYDVDLVINKLGNIPELEAVCDIHGLNCAK